MTGFTVAYLWYTEESTKYDVMQASFMLEQNLQRSHLLMSMVQISLISTICSS